MSKVQLVVEYADHQTRYYPANPGWRIDAASRCIVIGSDLPRTYVPLDQVVAFHVELVAPRADELRDPVVKYDGNDRPVRASYASRGAE